MEKTLLIISMVVLIVTGIIFIIEGISYLRLKKQNPQIPNKLYVAGILAIILGIIDIIFGGLHWFHIVKLDKSAEKDSETSYSAYN